MKRSWQLALLACVVATSVSAQAPMDPLSAALKRGWDGVALNLKESAEKMPAEKYSFKPSPDVKTFAGEIGHGANTHYFFCARIKGEPNPNKMDFEKETNKDALVKALIASNEYLLGGHQRVHRQVADGDGGAGAAGPAARGRPRGAHRTLERNLRHDRAVHAYQRDRAAIHRAHAEAVAAFVGQPGTCATPARVPGPH